MPNDRVFYDVSELSRKSTMQHCSQGNALVTKRTVQISESIRSIGMIKKLIEEWIVDLVLSRARIGGHCGCCGAYMPNEIFDNTWAWGLCTKCNVSDRIKAFGEKQKSPQQEVV